jgi:hypothetical protein
MPYTIKFTKKQVEQSKKELEDKLNAMSKEEFEKTQKFINEVSELKATGKLSKDEYLACLRAKILKDETCRKAIHEIQEKNVLEYDLEKAVSDFLKSKELPKTSPSERIAVLKIGAEQILDRKRVLITEKDGLDPDPVFIGKSEDLTEDIYEQYVRCRECKTVFKSFSNQTFCSSDCRKLWFSKNMKILNEVEEKIEAENNNETWNWERIGSKSDKQLGSYGIFRRVYND